MGKTLYLECSSGISGDMTAAALLDLGADREALERALNSLPVKGFRTEVTRVTKSGLDACDFNVVLDAEHENHDHDMEYLHGHGEHVHGDAHSHGDHGHDDAHSHGDHGHDDVHFHGDHCHDGVHSHGEHDHGGHHHEHRGLPEIREILMGSEMTDRAKEIALRIFQILAEAEAKAHGVPVDQVHFHEVGAVDSIVDIAAVSVCLDNLDIEKVIVPKLYEGTGFICCQHGVIPVPAPAVANIAAQNGLSLKITDIEGELVTPTGAAIVAAVRTSEMLPDGFVIERTGLGAGKRQYRCPGILRAMLIRETGAERDFIWRLETNIDDCTGEELGRVMGILLEAGARDVRYTPVYMKKNRPAYELAVICGEADVPAMEEIIFRETTTIGIRKMRMERTVLKREQKSLETPWGKAELKLCTLPDGIVRAYPEYESAAAMAQREGISYREAYDRIREYWKTER